MAIRTERRSYKAFEDRGTCMNEEILQAFERKMRLERLAEGTIQRYLGIAGRIDPKTKVDIENLLLSVTPAAHNGILAALRKLASYDLFPEKLLKGFKTVKIGTFVKSPEDLIIREDLQKLLAACENSRDRAFLGCLFESQCRPSELAMTTISDIIKVPGKYKIKIYKTKTNKPNTVYIYEFQAYLRRFIEDRGKWNGLLWFYESEKVNYKTTNPRELSEREFFVLKEKMRDILRKRYDKIRNKVDLGDKKIPLKLFRASGSVDKLKQGVPIKSVKKHGNWAKDSPVFDRHYVWLSEEDVENDFDRVHGIREEEKKRKPMSDCPNCGEPNSELQESCSKCGNVLTFDYSEEDDLRNLVMENESVKEAVIAVIMKYLQEEKEKEQ